MINDLAADETANTAVGTYGVVWLPYAVVGLALIALAITAAIRTRNQESSPLVEFLLIRGTALLLIATLVGLLADAASEGDGVTSIDKPIWSWFIEHRSAGLTPLMIAISTVGDTAVMGLIALAVAGALVFRPAYRGRGILVAVVAAGAGLLVIVTKAVVGRVRPPMEYRLVTETNQSFPSGHALASSAIVGVVAVVLVPLIALRGWRLVAITGAFLFVLLIGLSRLYLAVHWSTDVFGGWLIGLGWLLLCLTARELHRSYPEVRQLVRAQK